MTKELGMHTKRKITKDEFVDACDSGRVTVLDLSDESGQASEIVRQASNLSTNDREALEVMIESDRHARRTTRQKWYVAQISAAAPCVTRTTLSPGGSPY